MQTLQNESSRQRTQSEMDRMASFGVSSWKGSHDNWETPASHWWSERLPGSSHVSPAPGPNQPLCQGIKVLMERDSWTSGSDGKESACSACRPGFDLWVGKIPWRRKWQPTPVVARRFPWTEEPGRPQSIGLQRVGHDWATNTFILRLKSGD